MRATRLTPFLRNPTIPARPILPPTNPFQSRQTRQFNIPSLSSFAPTLSAPKPRSLTATRTLQIPPLPLFRTISDIDSYGDFLPFLTASKVTARDPTTGHPTSAYLTVGYGPLSETFESKVECDKDKWSVGARSGDIALQQSRDGGSGSTGGVKSEDGLFEYLDTIWKLDPLERTRMGMDRTKVELVVRFRFRSALHATMMSAVEDQVAGMMIEAFEKRVGDIEGK